MSNQPTKHLEIETYTLYGVNVNVEINYDKGTITLLETRENPHNNFQKNPGPQYQPKQWIFAGRTIDYMDGWRNILDAMSYAITKAETKLAKHLKEQEKVKGRKAVEMHIAMAAQEKKAKPLVW